MTTDPQTPWQEALNLIRPDEIDHCTSYVWHSEDSRDQRLLLVAGARNRKSHYDSWLHFSACALFLAVPLPDAGCLERFRQLAAGAVPSPIPPKSWHAQIENYMKILDAHIPGRLDQIPKQSWSLCGDWNVVALIAETDDRYLGVFWTALE